MTNPTNERPRAPRKFVTPVKYEVGKDLTHEKYEEILTGLTDWFRELYPKEKAPGSRARLRIQECMEGIKKDGSPWYDADTASLRARILSKCRFDIETMTPRRNAGVASLKKRSFELDRQKRRREEKAKKKADKMIPEHLRKEMALNYAYGENPSVFMTNAEQTLWQDYFDAYVEQFPELSTVNAKAELEALCDAHILKARFRAKMLNGQTVDPDLVAQIDKSLVDMKKALGIHPDQLAKRTKPKTAMSVGEAVLRLESMGDKWWQIRDRLAMQEFAMLYQMYHTPRADGIGYQLDEVGLFALTKCRVIACPKCQTEHFMGLTIEQIEEYLKNRGIIEEVTNEAVSEPPADPPRIGTPDPVDSGAEN